jgi:SAM-dependent methyltransferase
MPYKVYLWDALNAIEWSQAAWRIGGNDASTENCTVEMIHDVLLAHLPKDGLIVDAGCGTAKWPIYLGRRGYRCVGVEISHEACLAARAVDPTLRLVRGDTRHAPLATGCADAVLSLGVVEHDEAGPEAGLRELRRLLKPGGLLVLAVPFNNLFRRLVVNHLQRWVTWRRRRARMSLGFAEYRFSVREVQRHLADAGFELVTSYPNDLHPPKVMGLWVDNDNLVVNPLVGADPERLFVLPGWKGRLGRLALDHAPWLVCGEAAFIARAR